MLLNKIFLLKIIINISKLYIYHLDNTSKNFDCEFKILIYNELSFDIP